MKDKNKLLEILENADIDELWVNFENPFTEDHEQYGEKFYLCEYGGIMGCTKLSHCVACVISFFAPKFDSDEEEDVSTVMLWGYAITGGEDDVADFEKEKESLHLIYKKGVGILG